MKLTKKILLVSMAFSFTTSFQFSEQSLVQTAYAQEADYRASSNAIEMKTMNYSKVDTSTIKEGSFNVYVNGNKVNLTDKILVVNGNSFLPLRAIGDAIGATTSWDAVNKVAKIEFTNHDNITTSIEMSSDCTKMLVNGTTVVNVSNQNTSTATFIDPSTSRIYLPVRAISENLAGVKIEYFNDTRTISITTNGMTPDDPNKDLLEDSDREKDPIKPATPPITQSDVDRANVHNGERKPEQPGSYNNELSVGGNWRWMESRKEWGRYNGEGGIIDITDDVNRRRAEKGLPPLS